MIRDAFILSIRTALIAAATMTGLALCIGLANPERSGRAATEGSAHRIESPAPYRVLDAHHTKAKDGEPRLLAVETGRLESFSLPTGLSLELASLSPWEDRGRRQAVGLGWNQASEPHSTSGMSLMRVKFPGCEILDRVELNESPLPVGAPCWFPGFTARVLYAGGDGRIYRHDFETSRLGGDAPEVRPRALTWRTPALADGKVTLGDMSWPADARLGGKLLVSLYFNNGERGRRPHWQIWWLELDRDATSIIAAGPLISREAPDELVGNRRLPTLVHDAGNAPALAYLTRLEQQPGYQLKVAPIHLDPGSAIPHAREAEARVLAQDCVPAALAPSPDGRWITVVRTDGPSIRVERLALGGGSLLLARLP